MTIPRQPSSPGGGAGPARPARRWAEQHRKKNDGRSRGSIDWASMRDRVDLADVASRLLGPPPGRRGERGRRLWWSCPFHEDANPSFCIEPGRPWWRCFGCGEHGDAVALVMKSRRVGFREALEFLLSVVRGPWSVVGATAPRASGGPARSPSRRPPGPDVRVSEQRTTDDGQRTKDLVEAAERRLWTPEGAPGLDYLRRRGLSDATIRLARLGWMPGGSGSRLRGATIPWFGRDGLELVKVRQPDGCEPRYSEIYRRRPAHYPAPPLATIPYEGPVIVVEGEFDALLLGQELGGLAVVITLGSSSTRPTRGLLSHLSSASRLYLATDGDTAGDGAATGWSERARRVRPPGPHKDWTDAHRAGINLRWWWVSRLMADPHDAEERAAIQEHDGGLSREAAERAAADALTAAGLGVPLGVLTESEEAWLGRIKPGPQPDGGYVWIEY